MALVHTYVLPATCHNIIHLATNLQTLWKATLLLQASWSHCPHPHRIFRPLAHLGYLLHFKTIFVAGGQDRDERSSAHRGRGRHPPRDGRRQPTATSPSNRHRGHGDLRRVPARPPGRCSHQPRLACGPPLEPGASSPGSLRTHTKLFDNDRHESPYPSPIAISLPRPA